MGPRKPATKPALVLDIDETSLDNYACFERSDFDIVSALAPCVVAFDAPAIGQARSVFRFARRRKVAVFIITGRPEVIREGTRENLADAGYRGRPDASVGRVSRHIEGVQGPHSPRRCSS